MIIFNYYYKFLKFLLTLLILTLTAVVSYQLFSRNIEILPRISSTEEISRWIFIWSVFIGAAIGVRENTHFVIEIFSKESKLNNYLDILTIIAFFLVSVLLFFIGLKFYQSGLDRVSPISGLSLKYAYAVIPLTGFSMLVFTIEKVINTQFTIAKKEEK